ncbi:hypothetical protein [Engelhardtia mirabilis]|uniref:Uncharacterized protein n=1 Tax=Engelhardtia mirabilis TaxID=2528011 RepID=A0A518BID3_9BACT|nr:hypothetical protein Pla133_18160 [Planctomycetes bacterium Pla133]QDV01066.1 hypothetical protein Pla86_18150 [Planctomycetes bacterium Pla86]
MSQDRVDLALQALRDSEGLEPADRTLEVRLLAQHRWTRRRPRLLPLLVATSALTGIAFAAGGGVDWLRSLWVTVEVDGARVEGPLGDGEQQALLFTTDSGGEARVQVSNESLPEGGSRRQMSIEHREDGRVEVEESDDVFGAPVRELQWVSIGDLDGLAPIFDGRDAEGHVATLYLDRGPAGPRLLLFRPHQDAGRAVVTSRLPDLPPDSAPLVECELLDGGDLAVHLSAAQAFDLELLVRLSEGAAQAPAPPTTLETQDGRIKVRLEPERPR